MKRSFGYLTVFLLLTALGINSLQAKEFKLKLKKGDHFDYVFTSNDKVAQKMNNRFVAAVQESSLTFRLSVLERLKNGNYRMEADYKRFAADMSMDGNEMSYNSDSTYKSNSNWIADLLNGMTKIHLIYEISPLGVVSNLTGLEDLTKKISSDMRLSNLLKGIGTNEFVGQLLSYFPKGDVEPGAKWVVHSQLPELKDLGYDLNYTFDKATSDQVRFDFQAKFNYESPKSNNQVENDIQMKETITQNGHLILNPKTNMPETSNLEQVVDVMVTRTDQRTMMKTTVPMKITTENSLKLIKSK